MPLRTVDRCGDPAGINFPQLLGERCFRRRDILRALMRCQPSLEWRLRFHRLGRPSLARAFGSRSAATKNFRKDIAPFIQTLMLKTSPDRFDHCSGSACRLGFDPLGAYMTLFALAGNLNRQRASQAAGFAAVTIGAAVLIGGWAGPPVLSSWVAGFPPMRPSTALCVAALGLALVHPGKNSRFAFAVGLAVIAAAAFGLGLILFKADPETGIDAWLAPRAVVEGPGAVPFRLSTVTALAVGLAGGSLALSGFERHRLAATMLASIAGAIAAFALLGYLTGIDTLYGSVSVYSPTLPATVGLLCIAGGIILRIGPVPALREPRPLWHLLAMLGCAIIAPLLLFGAYAGIRIANAQLDQVREQLISEARTLSAGVDREIIGEIERLQALAASPSLRQGDFAEFQSQAEASLAMRQSGNIMLIDRNMQQLVDTWVPFGTHLEKTAVPEPVERAFATGKPQVTGLFMRPVTKQLLFAIIVPVQIDGESRYALARSPGQHALAGLVAANELPPGWHAVVCDATHRIIARSEQEDAFVGKELPPAQRHDAEPSGVFEFIDSEGRPSLQAYVRSELTGWETAVWEPKVLVEAPVRALWRTIGVMGLLAFALVIALALRLARIIARSVGHAARAAIVSGEGGPLLPSGTPVAEVNTLMAELRGAATRRQASDDLLRESKARLQVAIDVAQLGSWQYDPHQRLVSLDMRSKEIFDVAEYEAPIEEIMKLTHPDDAERVWAALEAVLDPAEPKRSATEFRLRRRNGEVRWVETLGLAYFEGSGRERRAVSMVGTVQDITERKEREEKEHLLMREVSHRAKNMLAVVHAIVHQTATKNPEDFVERFSERIQGLSASQDLLVRSDWNGVEIEDLVHAQLAHFAGLIGSRIAVHGPKLRLTAASAQAIGLALHELATNAGKYGALSTDTGRVDVGWGRDVDTFTMSWIEREGPPVSAPKRRGFGTIVMETMAERSVDGTVDLDYPPSGLTWRLTCPAANALEPGQGKPN
jgi:PAS domain S-box-containing protein